MSIHFADAFRILKRNKITKGEVAELLAIGPTYLSRIISGEKPLTEENADVLNKKYGHLVKFEPTPGRISPEMALLKELVKDYSELKEKVTNISASQTKESLYRKARLK